MARKKPSKAKKRVRALKRAEPTAVISDETEWSQFEPEDLKSAPHSFVIYRGKVGRYMKELMRDIRRVMEPFTASNLKMKKGNVLRDYVSIASYFHVTHLCILTRTQVSPYLKVCKVPRGPTLTFRILNYTLSRDVLSSLRKQVTFDAQFLHQPLLIMNNFSSESKTQDLVSKTFQNMFPSINVNKVRVAEIRRVLLLNYLEEDDTIELRHYTITFKTTGVSRGIKKILNSKNTKIPNLGRCSDIAEFLQRDEDMSESEAEDNTETVGVSQQMGVKVSKGLEEVGVKLVELGPRIKMQLIKVEEGLCEGEVLFHKIVEKTAEEKLYIRQQRNLKKKMKMARKREQDLNVQKKKKEKLEHKKRCLQGMGGMRDLDGDAKPEDDNDVDWYRKEVGEDPDQDTFARPHDRNSEQGFSSGRKRRYNEDDRDDSSFRRPKVSKFAKVKEKAKLLKKQKQLGITKRNSDPGRKPKFQSTKPRDGFRSSDGGGGGRDKPFSGREGGRKGPYSKSGFSKAGSKPSFGGRSGPSSNSGFSRGRSNPGRNNFDARSKGKFSSANGGGGGRSFRSGKNA